jgi:hypothetical protein
MNPPRERGRLGRDRAVRWPLWDKFTLFVEGLHIEARAGAARVGIPAKETQTVLQAALRFRWWNRLARRDPQRAPHHRVEDAVEPDGPRLGQHRPAALARLQPDVEAAVARGHGVQHRVVVDPDDRVADLGAVGQRPKLMLSIGR